MRTFIATFFFAILAFGANAQDRSSDIRSTIESQLKALQQDDFAAAFEFASPNIQTMFRNSANFGMMVQRGYPMVWRPKNVTFLNLRQENGIPIQRILVTDQEGATFVLDYFMVRTDTGWRINGVSLLTDLGPSA